MPAIFTHIQFGKEVAGLLPPALQAVISAHKECFYLGTQGPDLLFYHKPLKKKNNPARQKGWDLHAQSPEGFFLRAAKLITAGKSWNSPENAPLSAYLLGFLCHFTLDKTAHPDIDAFSVNGLTHGKIESELDKQHFKRLNMPIRGYNAATLFFPNEDSAYASAAILDVKKEHTMVAMKYMKRINGLFSSRCGLVHGFCHGVLTVAGMNKSFGEMFLHKKEDERVLPLLPKLDEDFEKAKTLAATILPEFFENLTSYVQNGSLENDFYRYDYSGNKEET